MRWGPSWSWSYGSLIYNYLQYTPSVSTIILSGRTYSSQNVRQIWESTLSKSDYLVGRESGYLKIFFTFLEVNMSNILWSMRICKRTFFPVCRMSGYVNTLVYFYLPPGRVAQRSIYNWNIVEKWRLNTHSLI